MKKRNILKALFLLFFITSSSYYLFVKSELYESKTILMVRDLSAAVPTASFGLSLLGGGVDSQTQDSMVVQEYLLSLDMFERVDKEFKLSEHYRSEALDPIERLSTSDTIEDILKFYQNRCIINYDEVSGLLHIAYSHTEPTKAKEILIFMVEAVEDAINVFNQRKAIKQLKFIAQEHKKNKDKMYASSAQLEEYQNSHLLLDPNAEATTSSGIIATLETKLTEKKIEYSTKANYLNSKSHELTSLKSEIKEISSSIEKHKKSLTSSQQSGLNKILFEYEKLKMQLEFDTEIYKNALIQLESIKLDTLKEAKTLSIVSQPNMPDGYTYPDKKKILITLLLITFMLYGIMAMIYAIIQDHKE
ncbi:MAG: hypothetical protein U9N39_03585 [Campylobacterota bacterium]|nr:hypothetical protein [Campylobacterota bacterium]